MKEEILTGFHFLSTIGHCTASFTDFENEVIYWADKCSCGSDVDEGHKCLRLVESEDVN
jgi:hypothetical protein